jgi:hypothetical protein
VVVVAQLAVTTVTAELAVPEVAVMVVDPHTTTQVLVALELQGKDTLVVQALEHQAAPLGVTVAVAVVQAALGHLQEQVQV